MFRFHTMIAFAVVGLASCSDGSQQGRFFVKDTTSLALDGHVGEFTIIHGDALPASPNSMGRQSLLYILCVAPGDSGGVSSSNSRGHISEWSFKIVSPQREYIGKLVWDRKSDQIVFEGVTFDRAQGNAFLVTPSDSGKLTAMQLGPIAPSLDATGALLEIRDSLPLDSPAKLVTLMKSRFAP